MTSQIRYYLLSQVFDRTHFDAVVRSHWGIEHQLDGALDAIVDEDHAQPKSPRPEKPGVARRIALILLEPSKGSMRGKLQRAGWRHRFPARPPRPIRKPQNAVALR